MESSVQLGFGHFMLPELETRCADDMKSLTTNLMKRLISNSRETICRIMHNSEKKVEDYLRHLEKVDLVFVLDNSGSMRLSTDHNSYLEALNLFGKESAWSIARYHEMAFVFLCMVHVLGSCGVERAEVRLLNPVVINDRRIDGLLINPTDPRDIQRLYSVLLCEPYGMTPLTSNLYESIQNVRENRHTHYIVFTDGCPYMDQVYDSYYEDSVEGLQRLLEDYFCPKGFFGSLFSSRKNLTINFIACTDDKKQVGYLDELDQISDQIDVTDDFYSEIKEVIDKRGEIVAMEVFSPKLSLFIYKAMIGCLDRAADKQDE